MGRDTATRSSVDRHATVPTARQAVPKFAHASEREFANILDFYQIAWLYEPHTFVLRRDAEGRPVECFSPDFYLPELDLYVELTTLRQRLVTKKNRKLRRLRDLYPQVNIKLFYARDVRNLLAKYGLAGLLTAEADATLDTAVRQNRRENVPTSSPRERPSE